MSCQNVLSCHACTAFASSPEADHLLPELQAKWLMAALSVCMCVFYGFAAYLPAQTCKPMQYPYAAMVCMTLWHWHVMVGNLAGLPCLSNDS